MDKDMQVDEEEREPTSSGFIFSRPNIIPSPDKNINFGIRTDKIFGGRPVQLPAEASAFTFAKPAVIERTDHTKPAVIERIDYTKPAVIERKDYVDRKKSPSKSHQISSFSAQDIKKSNAFRELEKNSKKNQNVRLEFSNSISCSDVPDSLLVKAVAKEYFEQFGETLKITIRPKRKMITVYYASKDDATTAFYKSGKFLGHEFSTQWTTSEMLSKPKKKESVKGKIASILNIDDEIKEELEAMTGLEYNIPDPHHLKALTIAAKAKVKKAKVVANKEIPKRVVPPILKPATKPIKPIIKIPKPLASEKAPPKVETHNQNIINISSANIEEMQNQVRQIGTTSEEKYKILDARDRLMRLKQGKQKSLATAKVTQGTCPDMCPEKERYMREFQRQLSSYEQLEGSEYKINHVAAVKQYSRSSADQEEPMAHDLRPVMSLKMTMSYLLHEIVDRCEDDEPNLSEWYHFLWDRMRSIRKDITQQELCCVDTVELVEQCARFHILSSERLCAEEASVFDPKINSENLTKCVQTLKYMYYDLRENGVQCKHEPEFWAYVILLNLNNGSFISELSTLPPAIQHSAEVKFALDVYSALSMDNYSRFFKLVRKTSYLNGCILLRYFNQIRVKALSVMVKAYCRASGTTEYPLYELIDILGFEDEEEVFEFCSQLGLKCDRESLYIKLKRESYRPPSGNLEQGRAFNLVLSKRLSSGQSIGQCIAGGEMPDKTYQNHKPHSSFDAQGYLLPSSINAQDQGLVVDPYEFLDEDEQPEQKGARSVASKAQNNVEEKRVANDSDRTTSAEFTFKPKTEITLPITTATTPNKIFPTTISSSNDLTPKPAMDTKLFASPPNATASSIFAKPAPTVFSSIPTEPSPMSTISLFSMPANKSVFSSGTIDQNFLKPSPPPVTDVKQANFKIPSVSTSSITTPRITSTISSSEQRVLTKRRLENAEDVVGKKSFLEKDEIMKKQLEAEQRLKAERDKLQRLEKIGKLSHEQYEQLENSVVEDICSTVVQAELDRIKLMDTLSENIFDGIFRQICEAILDEQLFIQDMLIEVDRRLEDRLVTKYYRIWKQWAARRRTQRREALDNTPVWLQPESIEECARKLYHPEQKVAIKYARENKRKSLVEEEEEKPKYTPIQFVVHVGLKENAKSLDIESSQHTFWKVVISWPLLENRLTLWRHKTLINKYLSPADYTLEPIFIQHKPSPHERLSISIRYFEGLVCENCLTGMDGLLFVAAADEEAKSIERRLTKSVLSREKLMPVPLVVLVFGDADRDPEPLWLAPVVERLLESGHVSEYTLLRERSVDETVVIKVLQSATLWLAINRSPAVPLEMDYLKRIFDDCLTEELWLRIQGHLAPKPRLAKALNDPNFIINLHNQAVNHIMDIVLDPESMMYTDFAPELKIYLPNKRSYPCTYEYFDTVWKHPEYRAELERVMSGFILPPWKEPWPIHDMMNLHDAIARYCGQILSHQSSLSITNNIMSDLFLISGHSEDNSPSFADVVIHIVGKKIGDIGGNTRVVYNKNHIKHFQMLPWWFKSSILQDYSVEHDEEMRKEENESFRQRQEFLSSKSQTDMELECNVEELSDKFWQQEEEQPPLKEVCDDTFSHVCEVMCTAGKLEKQLEEQRQRNQSLEARLKEALQDDFLGTGS